MILTAQAVESVVRQCLFADDETTDNAIFVEGIVATYGFHPERMIANHDTIKALLAELPDEFHADKGGGWSFLNACFDRQGFQWTSEHRAMEVLFCLGIAAGMVTWTLPREMWSAIPGNMPYVTVNIQP